MSVVFETSRKETQLPYYSQCHREVFNLKIKSIERVSKIHSHSIKIADKV